METGKRNDGNHQLGNIILMMTNIMAEIKVIGSLRSRQKKQNFLIINFDVRLCFDNINFINLLFIKMGLVT